MGWKVSGRMYEDMWIGWKVSGRMYVDLWMGWKGVCRFVTVDGLEGQCTVKRKC